MPIERKLSKPSAWTVLWSSPICHWSHYPGALKTSYKGLLQSKHTQFTTVLSSLVAEAVSPSSTWMWMRCGAARIGAVCGSQVLPVQVVANKVFCSIPCQALYPSYGTHGEMGISSSFPAQKLSMFTATKTRISTSISVFITVVVWELSQNSHQV